MPILSKLDSFSVLFLHQNESKCLKLHATGQNQCMKETHTGNDETQITRMSETVWSLAQIQLDTRQQAKCRKNDVSTGTVATNSFHGQQSKCIHKYIYTSTKMNLKQTPLQVHGSVQNADSNRFGFWTAMPNPWFPTKHSYKHCKHEANRFGRCINNYISLHSSCGSCTDHDTSTSKVVPD